MLMCSWAWLTRWGFKQQWWRTDTTGWFEWRRNKPWKDRAATFVGVPHPIASQCPRTSSISPTWALVKRGDSPAPSPGLQHDNLPFNKVVQPFQHRILCSAGVCGVSITSPHTEGFYCPMHFGNAGWKHVNCTHLLLYLWAFEKLLHLTAFHERCWVGRAIVLQTVWKTELLSKEHLTVRRSTGLLEG